MISLLILLLYKNMKSMPSMRSLLYRSLRPSIHIVRMLKLLVRKATINLSEPLLLDVVRWYKQKKKTIFLGHRSLAMSCCRYI